MTESRKNIKKKKKSEKINKNKVVKNRFFENDPKKSALFCFETSGVFEPKKYFSRHTIFFSISLKTSKMLFKTFFEMF